MSVTADELEKTTQSNLLCTFTTVQQGLRQARDSVMTTIFWKLTYYCHFTYFQLDKIMFLNNCSQKY